MNYRIGIDSGGTRVTAQAYSETGELLAEREAGPGNSLIHFAQTLQNIESVLTKLFDILPIANCELILAGVAGSQSAGNQNEIADFIEQTFHRPAVVLSDAELAMLKGLQGTDGILVIAGTGSIVLGQFNQTAYRAGGWGHLLGDQGSAYDLVRQAFKGMLREADKGNIGELTKLILPIIGVENVFEAVQLFNRLPRNDLAAFGKAFAEHGTKNQAFQKILMRCGKRLGLQVLAILDQIGPSANQSNIALSGSVLTNNQVLQKSFEQTIRQKYPEVALIPLVGTNASGVLYYRGE
ncbi:BadF/BadG/BcrA/BcrD ATPase family protein [Enterococcus sp. DIV0756]|uniref:BadF/BadG/BcrA/BcrD ATPase family protein n=1 Tax=Enterococcus sp. DIV0756 TaxID=2774636 RepID=UPI003F23878B